MHMLHGHTLKSAMSDYDQRHVIAFRPISVAARSWSYDNEYLCMSFYQVQCVGKAYKLTLTNQQVINYRQNNRALAAMC